MVVASGRRGLPEPPRRIDELFLSPCRFAAAAAGAAGPASAGAAGPASA